MNEIIYEWWYESKFLYGPVSPNFCARRSVMMILNLSKSLAKPLVMAKLNMAYLSSLKNRAKLLSSYLPVSPSRVLRAPGTSPYHLVPKHLRATWPRPEQSHLLPEACSPDGTDKRRQRQRRTKRPPPEPSNILKRFYALYDDKIRYFKKKVSKLYCYLTVYCRMFPFWEHLISAKIYEWKSNMNEKYMNDDMNQNFCMVPYLQIFAPGAALWWF